MSLHWLVCLNGIGESESEWEWKCSKCDISFTRTPTLATGIGDRGSGGVPEGGNQKWTMAIAAPRTKKAARGESAQKVYQLFKICAQSFCGQTQPQQLNGKRAYP